MDPESAIFSLIIGMIGCTGEIAIQVVCKDHGIRWLGKRLMSKLTGQDANTPALFMNILSDIKMLTAEIKFADVVHRASLLSVYFLSRGRKYTLSQTCLLIVRSETLELTKTCSMDRQERNAAHNSKPT